MGIGRGYIYRNPSPVNCGRNGAKGVVYRPGHPVGSSEIGVSKQEAYLPPRGKVALHVPLHNGAPRHPADCYNVLGCGGALASRRKTAHHDRALGNGVDRAVGGLQRRLDQGAALEALGVPHGAYRYVYPLARPGEGGQIGGDVDHGRVFALYRPVVHRYAELAHQIPQHLGGHGALVAGALEARYNPKADQLVGPDPFHICQILYSHGRVDLRPQGGGGEGEKK